MNSEILEDALKTQVIAWDKFLSPESGDEAATMSMNQLNKIVAVAADEVAKTSIANFTEKYEVTPKQKNLK